MAYAFLQILADTFFEYWQNQYQRQSSIDATTAAKGGTDAAKGGTDAVDAAKGAADAVDADAAPAPVTPVKNKSKTGRNEYSRKRNYREEDDRSEANPKKKMR